MLACLDVDYRASPVHAVAACVVFEGWSAAVSAAEHVRRIDTVQPYVPGQLYRRELPCLLAVLHDVDDPLEAIVVDGYVYLDDQGRPGLGAHLYEALDRSTPVVGVAKNFFRGHAALEVHRGQSTRPLYVSAAGMSPQAAAEGVARMHGDYRLPTVLKRVDRLCRDAER